MTIKEQIIQELDSLPEPTLKIILENIHQLKSSEQDDWYQRLYEFTQQPLADNIPLLSNEAISRETIYSREDEQHCFSLQGGLGG
jgi:hypothetical protein